MSKEITFVKVESSFAKPWNPKQGESIVGKYKGTEEISPKDGEPFISYRIKPMEQTFDDEGAEVKAWGVSGAFLASKFDQVPVGAVVRLTFLGMQKANRGQSKQFELEVAEGTRLVDPEGAPAPGAGARGRGRNSADGGGDEDGGRIPF